MYQILILLCLFVVSHGAARHPFRISPKNLKSVFPTGRIVGGADIDISKVPYQLALEWKGFQFCAASIISKTIVLSAGHCIEDWSGSELSVRMGSSQHEYGGTVIGVKRLISNPKYDPYTVDYDVSLIELLTPIQLDENVQPAPITDAEPIAGQNVTVSGWGKLSEGGKKPTQLQSVEVPIIDRTECSQLYSNLGGITERMICAGGAQLDSCQGDSGGPLTSNGEIVGVVSWGLGCARQGYPGVYTNVANPEIRKFIYDNAQV